MGIKIIINENQLGLIKYLILKEESITTQIKSAQLKLNQLGANLTVNGIYDEPTKEAIKNFQKENRFPLHHQTGGLDEKTKSLLFNVMTQGKQITPSKKYKLPLETPEHYNEKISNYVEIIKRIVKSPTNNSITYLHNLYEWFYENNKGVIKSINDLFYNETKARVSGELYYIFNNHPKFKNNKTLKKLIYYCESDLNRKNNSSLQVYFPPKNIDRFDVNKQYSPIINKDNKTSKPKKSIPYHDCSKKGFPYEYGCMGVIEIKEIQKLLGVKPTGNYGPMTFNALKKYSKDLSNTGITLDIYNKVRIKFSPKVDTKTNDIDLIS